MLLSGQMKQPQPTRWGAKETVKYSSCSKNTSSGRTGQEACLTISKRGKVCVIGKLVTAKPLNQLVLAIPYRKRQAVEHISLPPVALDYALRHGAKLLVVRLDEQGKCFSLPLADFRRIGWLRSSEGQQEYFVPLEHFKPVPWQEWPYVEASIKLDSDSAQPAKVQQPGLGLW